MTDVQDRQLLLAGRLAEVERSAAAARDTPEPVTRCTRWLAVDRQADRHLVALRPWLPGTTDELAEKLTEVLAALEEHRHEAHAALSGLGHDVLRRARARLGLRVAVVGKGGSGKTFIAGTLARVLARRGRQVLAGDLDANPGLAYTIGLGPTDAGLPMEALEEHPRGEYGWRLSPFVRPMEAVKRFAAVGPDRLRYLGIGKISMTDKTHTRRSIGAVLSVLRGLEDPAWDVLGDLEGGPGTPFERFHSFADLVIVVVGPSWVSGLTARRLFRLVEDVPTMVVANRMEAGTDHDGVVPALWVPADPQVTEAERRGLAPFDLCPGSPAIQAIEKLADILTHQEVTV